MILAYNNNPIIVGEGNYPFRAEDTPRCSACFLSVPRRCAVSGCFTEKETEAQQGNWITRVQQAGTRSCVQCSACLSEPLVSTSPPSSPDLGVRGWARPQGDTPGLRDALGDLQLSPRKRRAAPGSRKSARDCHFKLKRERAGGRAPGSARRAPGSVPGTAAQLPSAAPARPSPRPAPRSSEAGAGRRCRGGVVGGRPLGLTLVRARCGRPARNPEPGVSVHAGAGAGAKAAAPWRSRGEYTPGRSSRTALGHRQSPPPCRGPPGSAHSTRLHTRSALAHARPAQRTLGALPRPGHSAHCASHRVPHARSACAHAWLLRPFTRLPSARAARTFLTFTAP